MSAILNLIILRPLGDPRIERHKRHALADLVLLTICAVVSGANGWEGH
jgi:hypothetical protein